jgi:AmmeMemoRadiSam system protein A
MSWRRSSPAESSPELDAGSSLQPPSREAGPRDDDAWEKRFDALLLDVARRSIESGLAERRPLAVDCSEFPPALRLERATFVTLRREGRLRGCIGTLEADSPVAVSVADSAFKAAFRDSRFSPLEREELDEVEIHVSILSPLEPVEFRCEEDLVEELRPGIDGLVLRDGVFRGTFLPTVWESLSEPGQFLRELKRKAGLPPDYWSDTLEVWRYTTRSIY